MHLLEPGGDCLRLPAPRGEEDEGVEDLLIQAGRLRQRVVPPLGRRRKAPEQAGVERGGVLQVPDAEGDVACLVLGGEFGHLPRQGVGRVAFEEPEQIQERPLAEDREQE